MDVKEINLDRAHRVLSTLLVPESGFVKVVIIYGIAISLLTLAVPIAVQTLINTVANIASTRAILILSGLLLLTLIVSSGLSALRTHIMELYERRIYARLSCEVSLKTIMAPHSEFAGRRNTALNHRFYDIMTLQKNVPALLVDGFALVLQMLVGFTLVSFYHEALFLFNVVIILLIYLIWVIWSRGAKLSAVKLSGAKYATGKWLTDLTAAHEFFKSSRHIDYAGQTTNAKVEDYISAHELHFKYTFSQVVAFLVVYAFASAALLGLGGWLVIQGEISIGQLVAAELIMSAVFVGLSQFTNYLKYYYELYGAADKLGQILELPQESLNEDQVLAPEDATLECRHLKLKGNGVETVIDFKLEDGAKVLVDVDEGWIQRSFTRLLKMHERPGEGSIRLGGRELEEYDVYELREAITVIDRSLIVECSIKDYLRLAAPKATQAQINDTLDSFGLGEQIDALPEGINTTLSAIGAPLLPRELLLLKICAAVLSQPQLVLINQDFDNVPDAVRKQVLKGLYQQSFSVLYYTNKLDEKGFDAVLRLSEDGSGNGSKGFVVEAGSA